MVAIKINLNLLNHKSVRIFPLRPAFLYNYQFYLKIRRKDKRNNNCSNVKKSDFPGIEDWITANGTKIEPSQPQSKVSPINPQISNS